MKFIPLILFCSVVTIAAAAQPSKWSWGVSGRNDGEGAGVHIMPGNRILVAGTFKDTLTVENTTIACKGYNGFLAIYDENARLVHLKQSSTGCGIRTAAVDAEGNIYTCGSIDSVTFGHTTLKKRGHPADLYIASYTSEGELRWVNQIGGPGEESFYLNGITGIPGHRGVAMNATIVDTCIVAQDTIYGQGIQTLTACFNVDGKLFWHREAYGDSRFNAPTGIGVSADSSGNIYATGALYGTVHFGGYTPAEAGSNRPYVAKYCSDGQLAWLASASGDGGDDAMSYSSVVDVRGDVYIAGFPGFNYRGGLKFGSFELPRSDYFLAKVDRNGNWLWLKWGKSRIFGNASLATDRLGNIYMAGEMGDTLTMNGNALLVRDSFAGHGYVVRLRPSGEVDWAVKTGDKQTISAITGLAIDSRYRVYCTGSYLMNAICFGRDTLSAIGSSASRPNGNYFLTMLSKELTQPPLPLPSPPAYVFTAFPNPSNGRIALAFDELPFSGEVVVISITGQPVYRRIITTATEPVELNIDFLAQGTYWIQIQDYHPVQIHIL